MGSSDKKSTRKNISGGHVCTLTSLARQWLMGLQLRYMAPRPLALAASHPCRPAKAHIWPPQWATMLQPRWAPQISRARETHARALLGQAPSRSRCIAWGRLLYTGRDRPMRHAPIWRICPPVSGSCDQATSSALHSGRQAPYVWAG
eukprot:CAMPEP_0195065716 /NCGR_PEP_ID=MMETSP0448-20130528/11290_1 /TAXON_ID=66468 /ORGANISM="Heterocapsa triquestra, Strain CCMP 448" /LENGTH=146 /DNA_ID=CAMNT_0040096849 /DNA_START=8 /DNA_END=448 /DNA_ORIENTATION=+